MTFQTQKKKSNTHFSQVQIIFTFHKHFAPALSRQACAFISLLCPLKTDGHSGKLLNHG